MRKCEKCGKEHCGTYGSGRFCSAFCARGFSSQNDNKSETKEANCVMCGQTIQINKRASSHKCMCDMCKDIVVRDKHNNAQNKKPSVDELRPQILQFLNDNSMGGEIWNEFDWCTGKKSLSTVWHISNMGRVAKNMSISYGCKKKDGYMYLGNMRNIHRIVADAFIPKTQEDIEMGRIFIDHKNGIRDDNRASNLRWCTASENANFPLAKAHMSQSMTGDKNPNWGKSSPNAHKVLYNDGVTAKYFIAGTQPPTFVNTGRLNG